MPSLYFIQTGKRIHERREQLHETLQMFGEAATAMYAGNILWQPPVSKMKTRVFGRSLRWW